MSKSTIRSQFFINDGTGQPLPIQTGTFVTRAISVDEHRRLSLTIGIGSSTGAVADVGGFTGILQVQGTDEMANAPGATGTPWAAAFPQPGNNGYTGALFWNTIPSGSIAITNATNSMLVSLTDVNCAFVRLAFNRSATGALPNSAASGTMYVYLTGKHS